MELLTREKLKALPDRELDVLVAEWLGLPVVKDTTLPHLRGHIKGDYYAWADIPHYSQSLDNFQFGVMPAIGQKEIIVEYTCALAQLLGVQFPITATCPAYCLIHATARERCEAFVTAMQTEAVLFSKNINQ